MAKRWQWAFFPASLLIVAAVYAALAATISVDAFWTPDSGAKHLELVSLRGDQLAWGYGGLVSSIPYPAQTIDPDVRLPALPFSFGFQPGPRFQSWFPVWFSALSWLPFKLLGLRGLLLLPVCGGIASAAFMGFMAERWRPGRGWIAVLLTAFATPVFFYSQVFWEHTLAVALTLAAVCLVGVVGKPDRLAPAFILMTLAVALRRELALAQLALVGWTEWRLAHCGSSARRLLAAGLLGLVLVGAGQLAWGSRLPLAEWPNIRAHLASAAPGTSETQPPAPAGRDPIVTIRRVIGRAQATIYNTSAAVASSRQPYAWLTWAATMLAVFSLFLTGAYRWGCMLGAAALMIPPVVANVLADARSSHGIVLTVPLVLLALPLVQERCRRSAALVSLLMSSLVLIHFAVLDAGPPSGLEWGSRVALLVYPIAAGLVAAMAWPGSSRGTSLLAGSSLIVLVALSVATQVRGVSVLRANLAGYATWTSSLRELPQPLVVITDFPFLTSVITPAFDHAQFVYVDPGAGARIALEYLGGQPALAGMNIAYMGYRRVPSLTDWLAPSFRVDSAQVTAGLTVAQLSVSL